MSLVLTEDSPITDEVHAAVQREIQNFFRKNLKKFRQELIDDLTNNDIDNDEGGRFGDFLESGELEEAFESEPDYFSKTDRFVQKWIRQVLYPTVIDHLNITFCGTLEGPFGRRGRNEWIYFGKAPKSVHWFLRARNAKVEPSHFAKYPDPLRELLPELIELLEKGGRAPNP